MKNVILRNNIQTYIFLFDSNNVREFNNATAYTLGLVQHAAWCRSGSKVKTIVYLCL